MGNLFDDISRILARPMSRGRALKLIAGTFAASFVVTRDANPAEAQRRPQPEGGFCPDGRACDQRCCRGPFSECVQGTCCRPSKVCVGPPVCQGSACGAGTPPEPVRRCCRRSEDCISGKCVPRSTGTTATVNRSARD